MSNSRSSGWLFPILAATMLAAVAVVIPYGKDSRKVAPGFQSSLDLATQKLPPSLELVSFLPRNAVRDGSVDYTTFVQAAIDAAANRTLRLAPFPVRVSKRPGSKICLSVRSSMVIEGTASSELVDPDGASMILYCDAVDGLRLANFTLRGRGTSGAGQAHGSLQVTGGSNILIDGINSEASDADGIVVANASDVRVRNCRVSHASKAGIYLSNCARAVVSGNVVVNMVGHTTPDGRTCGAAMQLSGNRGLVCTDNVLEGGVGIGILCNANEFQPKPEGNLIANNRIRGFKNADNPNVSCGIRLENSNPDTQTGTLVEANAIDDCGMYGILVENHGGSVVRGNSVRRSERSGIVVGKVRGALIEDNWLEDCVFSQYPNQAGVYVLSHAREVVVRGNLVRTLAAHGFPLGFARVRDEAGSPDVSIEAHVEWADAPPIEGRWEAGDRVLARNPARGEPSGWVCTEAGLPGVWCVSGRVE